MCVRGQKPVLVGAPRSGFLESLVVLAIVTHRASDTRPQLRTIFIDRERFKSALLSILPIFYRFKSAVCFWGDVLSIPNRFTFSDSFLAIDSSLRFLIFFEEPISIDLNRHLGVPL